MARSTKPAEGERRAVGGYSPQYDLAAALILRALRDGTLRWVRLADPEAGRLDDIQVGSVARVDAFLVKWSRYQGSFTFLDLTKPGRKAPSLIGQLADGWTRLRIRYPGERVVVHLVTNDVPSTNDTLAGSINPPTPAHFAAFVEQAWRPAHNTPPPAALTCPSAWQQAWDEMLRASSLAPAAYEAFVRDCNLDFGFQFDSADQATRDGQIWRADHALLRDLLLHVVADPEQIVMLTREQLLERLGWKSRTEFISRHEFPVNEVAYQPIEATAKQLDGALAQTVRGYLAVLGTPGSGKSTLLTHTLRARPERVIRYYAYIPDTQDPSALCGEAVSFLHDVTTAIDLAGFPVGRSLSHDDHHQLLDRFHQQMHLLSAAWEATGQKTVLLIDGLDYIAREQNPLRSLLLDLPEPATVPEGVVFVLGSQTVEPLPPSIRAAIQEPGRQIEMKQLDRGAVLQIVERAGLPNQLSAQQRERICEVSAGHPLALAYLLQRMASAADAGQIEEILADEHRYTGAIEAQYYRYWASIEGDEELTELLGLFARMRGGVRIDWVKTWNEQAKLRRLSRSAGHYFRREDDRWYFFHNSFRLFLLEQTPMGFDGRYDPRLDEALHHTLAERCAALPDDSPGVGRRSTIEWVRGSAKRSLSVLRRRGSVGSTSPYARRTRSKAISLR